MGLVLKKLGWKVPGMELEFELYVVQGWDLVVLKRMEGCSRLVLVLELVLGLEQVKV